MTTSSLRQLALNSEPPSRKEYSIAIVTLYAVLFSLLAYKAIEYLHSTDMESWAPSSHSNSRTYNV